MLSGSVATAPDSRLGATSDLVPTSVSRSGAPTGTGAIAAPGKDSALGNTSSLSASAHAAVSGANATFDAGAALCVSGAASGASQVPDRSTLGRSGILDCNTVVSADRGASMVADAGAASATTVGACPSVHGAVVSAAAGAIPYVSGTVESDADSGAGTNADAVVRAFDAGAVTSANAGASSADRGAVDIYPYTGVGDFGAVPSISGADAAAGVSSGVCAFDAGAAAGAYAGATPVVRGGVVIDSYPGVGDFGAVLAGSGAELNTDTAAGVSSGARASGAGAVTGANACATPFVRGAVVSGAVLAEAGTDLNAGAASGRGLLARDADSSTGVNAGVSAGAIPDIHGNELNACPDASVSMSGDVSGVLMDSGTSAVVSSGVSAGSLPINVTPVTTRAPISGAAAIDAGSMPSPGAACEADLAQVAGVADCSTRRSCGRTDRIEGGSPAAASGSPARGVYSEEEYVSLGEQLSFCARIAGIECSCVLDPGSSISIMSKDLCDSLPGVSVADTLTMARVANGEPLSLLGQCTVPLTIGRRQFSARFQVSDSLDVPCLIGLDFLEQVPSVIDLVNRRLILVPAGAVRFTSTDARAVGRVVLGHDVSVPPGVEHVLQGYVHSCEYSGPVVFEPTLSIPGLEATRALACIEGGKVPVVIRNISASHVTIPRHTPVGDLEVDFIEEPIDTAAARCDNSVNFDRDVNSEGANLSPAERSQLIGVLKRYESMFDGHLGLSDLVVHDIETGGARPVRQTHRRIPPHLQAEVKEQLDELVRLGVLVESNGSWASPICIVRKRSGKVRVVCDMRRLNAVTELPSYPIPKISDVLDGLNGSKLFTTLDMNMAYYQVKINPEHQQKATITTPWKNYSFTRMCFGLSGASFTCARLLSIVLGDIIPDKCLCYFDDIIVRGSCFAEMMENLDAVLSRMSEAGLTLNLAKCLFCQPKVTFLGHVVSEEGLSPDPVKVEAVLAWPTPRTAKQMASFLGLCNYFKGFIQGYSGICSPLFRLCNRDVRFEWTDDCQLAFERVKQALTEAPVLTLPSFDADAGEFVLECDASGTGVGAVLLQVTPEGEKVIAYGSKKLSKSQQNYSATKRELLACVTFVSHFKHYLIGKKFRLRTDHSSLQWLLNFRNPTGILARWLETLSAFTFDIEYKRGCENGVADALSRTPAQTADAGTQTEPVQAFRISDSANWSLSFIRAEQESDPAISELSEHLSRGRKPNRRQVKHCVSLLRQWSRLRLVNGVVFRLYRRRSGASDELQVVLPQSLRSSVLESLHGGPAGGHFGPEKLLAECRVRFFWDRMEQDVRNFCQQCTRCEGRNQPVPAPRAAMGRLYASRPFEVVGLDILTGLPVTPSGNRHLLVVVDFFSKWTEAFPLKDLSAASVATVFVDQFVARFGCPERVHSDQGGCFVSELLELTCKRLGIERSTISSAHPSGNGIVERANRTVLAMLAKFLDDGSHNRWDEHIPLLMLAYRAQASKSTGFSPYKLVLGREPRLPAEAELEVPTSKATANSTAEYFDRLRESLRLFHEKALRRSDARHSINKRAYDRKINELEYDVGETVLLHRAVVPRGQYYKFLLPYKRAVILDKLGPLNYRVRPEGARKTITVHHNRLAKARPTPAPRSQMPDGM